MMSETTKTEARRPTVLLIGLTGFGNRVLDGLLWAGCDVVVVVDPDETTHPHYSEVLLVREAAIHARVLDVVFDVTEALARTDYDFVVVATWHHKLPIVERPMFNFHPGKLPQYRGATPTYWTIRDGERTATLSVHALTAKLDAGAVYYEYHIPLWSHMTDGELRRELADVSKHAAFQLVHDLRAGCLPVCREQVGGGAARRKRDSRAGVIENFGADARTLHNQIRAALPWPGASTAVGVDDACDILQSEAADVSGESETWTEGARSGTVVSVDNAGITTVLVGSGALRLKLRGRVEVGVVLGVQTVEPGE